MGKDVVKNLVIVGLGPGGMDHLSTGTLVRLKKARRLFLRTGKHPVVEELSKMGIRFDTFDLLYEQSNDFTTVYSRIAEALIKATESGQVVFAVPGHPLVGEESVRKIIELAKAAGITYEIVPALSFIDVVLTSLEVDFKQGLKVIDGCCLIGEQDKPESRPDPQVSNLVMQVYNSRVASEVKLSLLKFYPPEYGIKVIVAAGVPGLERIMELPLFELDRLAWIDHLTCVLLPPDKHSKSVVSRFPLDRPADIMEQLRDVNGCPWDREQTHTSLKKYLIEETYEVLEAIDEGNMHKVCEELGDLLLQIVFHAQIAREGGFFDLNDVIGIISAKLIRRHPHVFGSVKVSTSEEVSQNWEEIKKGELDKKGENRQSLLDGVPNHIPVLIKADKVQRKAAKIGFDWPDYTGALDKVGEEITELKDAIAKDNRPGVRDEIGDLLFAVVNLARLLEVNSDEALTMAVRKFKERFMYMEKLAAQGRVKLADLDLKKLDELWEEAKQGLNGKKS